MKQDVVEDLGRHVLRSRHRKLLQVREKETAAEIDQLDSSNVGLACPHLFLAASLQQNVFGLEVGMDDVVAVDEEECLGDFHDQYLELVLVCPDSMDKVFVLDLLNPKVTL